MKVAYDPALIKKLKRVKVRIRKSFKQAIFLFTKDPNSLQLDNHALREKYQGYRSIDVTADYRAIYREIHEDNVSIDYFTQLGTHKELFVN
jgi:addiction module RelE/StbE family toxin